MWATGDFGPRHSDLSALRPYSAAELLEQTLRLYRALFLPCLALVLIVTVPLLLINDSVSRAAAEEIGRILLAMQRATSMTQISVLTNQLLSAYTPIVAALIITALIQAVLLGGPLTFIASERFLGRSVTVVEAFRAVSDRFFNLGAGLILFTLIMVGLSIGMAFVFFMCGLGIVLLVYLAVGLSALLVPVLVLERVDTVLGLWRAWTLGRARFWPIFSLIAAMYAAQIGLGLVLGLAIQLFIGGAGSEAIDTASLIAQGLAGAVLAPFLPVGLTLIYYDARVRVERLDLALASCDRVDPRPEDVASPRPAVPLFAAQDFVNMLILAGVLFGLLVLHYALLSLVAGGLPLF